MPNKSDLKKKILEELAFGVEVKDLPQFILKTIDETEKSIAESLMFNFVDEEKQKEINKGDPDEKAKFHALGYNSGYNFGLRRIKQALSDWGRE